MLSIFLTLCGLYTLSTGKLHSILAGGAGSRVSGHGARMVGMVLVLALPLSLALRLALPALIGESALMFGAAIELVSVALILAAAFVASRRVRRQTASA